MWKSVKLGDVLELIQNGINCDQDKSGSGVKITRIETIADANINFNKTGFAHLSDAQKARAKLEKGDILFSHINSAIHVGKTAIYNGEEDLFHGINLLRMRPTPYVDSYYLNLFLKSLFWSGYWRTACKQSVNQASVNQTDIKSISFSYPPLAEQQRIVEKLDKAFEEIDRAIEATSSALSSSSVLLEKTISLLLKDPSYGWNIYTLNEISTNLDSKRIPITKADRNAGIYPYYGASGIVDYVNNWIFDETILLVSEDGANLLMRNYPIAFTATGKCWVNNHAHVLRFNEPEIHAWVEAYLNSIDISQFVSGMAQPKLNQKKLNEIPIPIPNKSLINDLNEKIESVYELSKDYSLFNSQKISSLNALKSAILTQELKGSE